VIAAPAGEKPTALSVLSAAMRTAAKFSRSEICRQVKMRAAF